MLTRKSQGSLWRALLLGTLLSVSTLGSLATAQEACPAGFLCTTFDGQTVALDPASGPIQYMVWSETTLSTRTVTEESLSIEYSIVEFRQNDDGQFVAQEPFTAEDDGIFKDAEPGDVFVLTKVV
jgi:hypothetical protein